MTDSAVLYFEDVAEGMLLPAIVRAPTIVTSARVSAATDNYHRIHWDREFARQDGLPDAILATNYLGNAIAQLVMSWITPRGTLRKLAYRFKAPVFPGDILTVGGMVTRTEVLPEGGWVELEVWIEKGGRRVTEGTGAVLLPLREAATGGAPWGRQPADPDE